MWYDVINCGSDTLCSVSDVKHIVGAMSYIQVREIMEGVGGRHRYSGCDGTNIVNTLLYTMDMMSPPIEDEIS